MITHYDFSGLHLDSRDDWFNYLYESRRPFSSNEEAYPRRI